MPIVRLAALGRAYVAFGRERPMHYQLMFMQRADFLQAQLAARANRMDPLAVLREGVAAAASAGAIRAADPQVITLSLWAAVHGLVGLLLIGPPLPEEQIRALVDTTIAAMLAGLTHA